MLTTSSHDTKRGEDARARIATLSGYAGEWTAAVHEWCGLLESAGAPKLEPNDSYYFFQLLLGAWPTTLTAESPAEIASFAERLEAAMLKSVREARMKTNWSVPKTDYEDATSQFVRTALSDRGFINSFIAFESRVAAAGAQNGLIETLLKLTVPGVPDIYQGAEYWEQSMVDPDNRRAVDFALRAESMDAKPGMSDLVGDWRNGRIKQRLITDVLGFRAEHDRVFAEGSYEPLDAGDDTIAFVRRIDKDAVLVAARLYPWRQRVWANVSLQLPEGLSWDQLYPIVGDLDRGNPFATLPVAVLGSR